MSIQFTRIKYDSNGNPRYVCHFLNLLTEEEKEFTDGYRAGYAIAVARSHKIGGRKYHTKAYGGGIVFQSYNIRELEKDILELVAKS
jgi:hypothetical protein